MKVLASSHVMPGGGYGHWHKDFLNLGNNQDEFHRSIPGERPLGTEKRLSHGILMEIRPQSTTKGHVAADLRLELSGLHETKSTDFIATSGESYHFAGRFALNERIRIELKRSPDDVPRWIDVYFETSQTNAEASVARVDGKLVASPLHMPRLWLPKWLTTGGRSTRE
jgi:hypothetical protein